MTGRFPVCFVVVALVVLFPSVSEGKRFVQRRPEDCPQPLGNCTTELTEKEGGTASLRCPLAADLSRSTFRASKDQSTNIVYVRKNGHDNFADQNKTFQDRTSLSNEAWQRGIAELNISSLEPDDAGIYEFYLDGNFTCQFVLRVKSQEPSQDGEAPTSASAPSEMPRPSAPTPSERPTPSATKRSEMPPASTPSDDQPTDNTGMYIGIGVSIFVAAIAIALVLYRCCCRKTDTNVADASGAGEAGAGEAGAGEADPCLDEPAQEMRDEEPPIPMSQLHSSVE